MPQELQTLVDALQTGGLLLGAAFFIYANHKGWIRWGREYDAVAKERDELKRVVDEFQDGAARKLDYYEREALRESGRGRSRDDA